jgi:hypothetical protein
MRSTTVSLRVAALFAAFAASGCTGSIGDVRGDRGGNFGTGAGGTGAGPVPGAGSSPSAASGAPGAPGQPGSGGVPAAPPGTIEKLECKTPAIGKSPLRRLTHAEYDNAVNALLGDQTHPAREFPADTEAGLFDNTATTQTVAELLAEQYIDSAAELAKNVTDVNAVVGCSVTDSNAATCVRGFVTRFGRKAYRRPLTQDEVTSLVGVFDAAKAASDATTGARAVIASVLASPNFVFRPEFGGSAGTIAGATRLTQYEVGARLSSLIWASIPDDTLLDAAQANQLSTPAQIATQARRMLADPKAKPALAAFYDQWFGLKSLDAAQKDSSVYPAWSDTLRNSMRESTRRFVSSVVFDGDGKLSTLLTSTSYFVNQPLAALYGVSGPADSNTYSKVTMNAAERAGILTQASMLASFASVNESSPAKRGKWVRVRLLCQDLPDPPANIPELEPPREGVSTRERFAQHTSDEACSGCHSLIDGLGFGLEQYDGIGRFRTLDRGVVVDSSGEVTKTGDTDVAYEGGAELATILAGNERVQDCAPTQWLRYALGRREVDDDACSIVALRDAFRKSNGDLREVIVALAQTDTFLNYRRPE